LFNVITLGVILTRRRHMQIDQRLRTRLSRMALAALAMATVLVVVQRQLFVPGQTTTSLFRWVALTVLVGCGLLAYAACGQLLRAFDLRELLSIARRRAPQTNGGVV
jgi:putative peptidoglycan lipid II flippase